MKINKKGFTLVELLSVLILLIVIMTIATLNFMPSFDNGKKNALIDEAHVMSDGAYNKYNDDRISKNFIADVFASKVSNKRCYSVKSLFGGYVSKSDKNYHGSVELCLAESCDYKSKIWLTDGEKYINGAIVDDSLSINSIENSSQTNYFDSCGMDIENINNEWLYDFVGEEELFVVPKDGKYSIEAWGASGANAFYMIRDMFGTSSSPVYTSGGKGGYTYVEMELETGEVLHINVGERGEFMTYDIRFVSAGSYNGGGKANYHVSGGGGATSVSFNSGILSSQNVSDLVAVAGGGAGGHNNGGEYCLDCTDGSNGGGYCDSRRSVCNGSGTFGKVDGLGAGGGLYTTNGAPTSYPFLTYSWGGATWYYTNTNIRAASGGGTGYFGHPRTIYGAMYVLNANTASSDQLTTYSTANYSQEPIAQYAKEGDGFVRITLMSDEV